MIVKMGYMLQKEERRMGGGNVSQDQTSIICIDLKSFYASVECVERGLNPFKTNLEYWKRNPITYRLSTGGRFFAV